MNIITNEQYLQLTGLLALAGHHNRALLDIRRAALEITGEETDSGRTGDAVYGEMTIDDLLHGLAITVAPRDTTPAPPSPAWWLAPDGTYRRVEEAQ